MSGRGEIERRVRDFLAAHHVLSLATAGPEGPHAANLFYACDGLSPVWVSETETRHSREIEGNPKVAATIAPDCAVVDAVKGLQIAGRAYRIDEPGDRRRLLALLEMRYPFLKPQRTAPEKMRQALARTSVYRLDPDRFILIDNQRGFGHKDVLDLTT